VKAVCDIEAVVSFSMCFRARQSLIAFRRSSPRSHFHSQSFHKRAVIVWGSALNSSCDEVDDIDQFLELEIVRNVTLEEMEGCREVGVRKRATQRILVLSWDSLPPPNLQIMASQHGTPATNRLITAQYDYFVCTNGCGSREVWAGIMPFECV
jgi:hypothetical protein